MLNEVYEALDDGHLLCRARLRSEEIHGADPCPDI